MLGEHDHLDYARGHIPSLFQLADGVSVRDTGGRANNPLFV